MTWFFNRINTHKIYVFLHIKYMFGVEINKNIIEKVKGATSKNDLYIAHKILMDNLNIKESQRQKMKHATKLFSHTISRTISRVHVYHIHGLFDSENWLECSEFFKNISDWLKFRIPEEHSRDRVKAFGLAHNQQIKIEPVCLCPL